MEVFKPFIGYAKTDTNILSTDIDVADPELDNTDDIHNSSNVNKYEF
jgi:hypothetical protein